MTTLLFFYFWISNFSFAFAFIFFLLSIPSVIVFSVSYWECWENNEETRTVRKYCKVAPILAFIFIMLNSIPNIKQMSMIFGIPAAMEIMKNPEVAKLPNNVLQIINQELEEKITKKEETK